MQKNSVPDQIRTGRDGSAINSFRGATSRTPSNSATERTTNTDTDEKKVPGEKDPGDVAELDRWDKMETVDGDCLSFAR